MALSRSAMAERRVRRASSSGPASLRKVCLVASPSHSFDPARTAISVRTWCHPGRTPRPRTRPRCRPRVGPPVGTPRVRRGWAARRRERASSGRPPPARNATEASTAPSQRFRVTLCSMRQRAAEHARHLRKVIPAASTARRTLQEQPAGEHTRAGQLVEDACGTVAVASQHADHVGEREVAAVRRALPRRLGVAEGLDDATNGRVQERARHRAKPAEQPRRLRRVGALVRPLAGPAVGAQHGVQLSEQRYRVQYRPHRAHGEALGAEGDRACRGVRHPAAARARVVAVEHGLLEDGRGEAPVADGRPAVGADVGHPPQPVRVLLRRRWNGRGQLDRRPVVHGDGLRAGTPPSRGDGPRGRSPVGRRGRHAKHAPNVPSATRRRPGRGSPRRGCDDRHAPSPARRPASLSAMPRAEVYAPSSVKPCGSEYTADPRQRAARRTAESHGVSPVTRMSRSRSPAGGDTSSGRDG